MDIGPRSKTGPYKMLVLLQHAQVDGFTRAIADDGTVVVEVHWPTLRRMMHQPGGRMLKYLDFLLERKYAIMVQRRRGYTTLALPPPVEWPVRATPGPDGGTTPAAEIPDGT